MNPVAYMATGVYFLVGLLRGFVHLANQLILYKGLLMLIHMVENNHTG
jgi:hypothetical protein